MLFTPGDPTPAMTETTVTAGGVTTRYTETDGERVLSVERADGSGPVVAIAQNREGYAMLKVRVGGPDGDELERYYGFDMALDHAAELLGVDPTALPVPEPARDMGM